VAPVLQDVGGRPFVLCFERPGPGGKKMSFIPEVIDKIITFFFSLF